jgi:hypothetical protein
MESLIFIDFTLARLCVMPWRPRCVYPQGCQAMWVQIPQNALCLCRRHIAYITSPENETMKAIGEIYTRTSLKLPEIYLGAKIGQVIDSTGTRMTYMLATDYIGGALKTVEASLPADRK